MQNDPLINFSDTCYLTWNYIQEKLGREEQKAIRITFDATDLLSFDIQCVCLWNCVFINKHFWWVKFFMILSILLKLHFWGIDKICILNMIRSYFKRVWKFILRIGHPVERINLDERMLNDTQKHFSRSGKFKIITQMLLEVFHKS